MAIRLLGRKVGMTRLYMEDGAAVPVTVLEVEPNRVSQVKTVESDGYNAIQLTAGVKKASRVTKAQAGHFKKAGVQAGIVTKEVRDADGDYSAGDEITVSAFNDIKFVDVSGRSKGKGFAGTIKRHNFAGKDATHGNSINHRTPGSIGQNQTPGRVFKGKKMSGHMGDVNTTVQTLEVVRIDEDRNLMLVKGAVPGARDGRVEIKPAIKKA